MKFVFPLLNLNKSGGIRIAIQYAEGLANLGHEVKIITSRSNSGSFVVSNEIKIEYVKQPLYFNNNFALLLCFLHKIKKDEIIISTSWQSTLISVLNFVNLKKIMYIIQHDDKIILNNKNIFKHLLFRIIYKLPTNRISVSLWLQNHLQSKYGIKTFHLSNGINFEYFNNFIFNKKLIQKQTFTILCLARNVEWKGFNDFLIGMEYVYKKFKNIRLNIVSQENIIFNTDVPYVLFKPDNDFELGEIYRNSDIFVFTSWLEGFGLPPLEALANGCPVVSTTCGGVDDFLINGYNSILIPIKSPKKIADATIELLNSENLRTKLKTNGFNTAKQFDFKITLEKFIQHIDNSLKI